MAILTGESGARRASADAPYGQSEEAHYSASRSLGEVVMQSEKMFILYDGRARYGDEDNAAVLVTAETEREARSYRGDFNSDSIWFEYKLVDGVAIEGRRREDIRT